MPTTEELDALAADCVNKTAISIQDALQSVADILTAIASADKAEASAAAAAAACQEWADCLDATNEEEPEGTAFIEGQRNLTPEQKLKLEIRRQKAVHQVLEGSQRLMRLM